MGFLLLRGMIAGAIAETLAVTAFQDIFLTK
jgi:hypothetical protein